MVTHGQVTSHYLLTKKKASLSTSSNQPSTKKHSFLFLKKIKMLCFMWSSNDAIPSSLLHFSLQFVETHLQNSLSSSQSSSPFPGFTVTARSLTLQVFFRFEFFVCTVLLNARFLVVGFFMMASVNKYI